MKIGTHWKYLALASAILLAALISGVAVASYQEQDDRFCGSCHTQPETEFLSRNALADQTQMAHAQDARDLASFHHRKAQTRCINCHVGEGVPGRALVLSLAAWDAFKHYTGIARQPAVVVFTVQNEGCAKCHAVDIRTPGFQNHFHNIYFDSQASPPSLRCVDCHVTHRPGDERTGFQFRDALFLQCEYCHVQMNRGPRGLSK